MQAKLFELVTKKIKLLGILHFLFFSIITQIVKYLAEFCLLEPMEGPCTDRVHMFYFDNATQTCPTFIYGGCRVNYNVFSSVAECMYICTRNESEGESLFKVQIRTHTVCLLSPTRCICIKNV